MSANHEMRAPPVLQLGDHYHSDKDLIFDKLACAYVHLAMAGSASGSGLTVDVTEPPSGFGDDIVANVLSFFAGLSLPALAGIAAAGGLFLLIIVVLFLVSSIALLRDRCNKNKVRQMKVKQVRPARVSW